MGDNNFVQLAPDCSCGRGKMRMFCAGPYASNPGRCYFKCPEGLRHYKSFIWCDLLNPSKESTSSSSVLRQHISSPTVDTGSTHLSSPVASTSEGIRKRIFSDRDGAVTEPSENDAYKKNLIDSLQVKVLWHSLVLIIFLACILIMLGVVVGMHLGCS